MRYLMIVSLVAAAAGVTASTSGCDDGPGDWGPECENLAAIYDDCIPDFCQGKSCPLCECWNSGYPDWTAAGDCVPPDEDHCAGAAGYIDEYGCDGIQSSYARFCE